MTVIPILLVPGLNATPRVFREQLDVLFQSGPVTIADHRRGTTMREIAAHILRDAPPRFVLGGFSMGGYVALEMMRQAPDRVIGLILIDTSARPDTPEAAEKRRAAMATAQAGKLELAAASSYPTAVHPSNLDNSALKAIHIEMARRNGTEAYIRQQEAIIARVDSRPGLKDVRVPTLVIVGDSDQITPPQAAREMADAIAGSELVEIKDAGHLALLEQPAQVNDALARWLAGKSAQFDSN